MLRKECWLEVDEETQSKVKKGQKKVLGKLMRFCFLRVYPSHSPRLVDYTKIKSFCDVSF